MPLKTNKKPLFLAMIFFISVFLIFRDAAPAAKPYSVLILPLHIHSEKDLSFLKNGVEDMLSTRLTREGEIVPLSKEEAERAVKDIPGPIDEQTALSLGERLNADYVLYGSLTVFGNSISTDVRFVDVHQKKPLVTFSQSGENQGDVISHIDLFASQVNEKVFGRKTDSYAPPEQKRTAVDTHRHPDSLWTGDQEFGAGSPGAMASEDNISFSFWKSRNFKTKIIGLAVGDVDGDGRNETVFISDNTIYIYRYNDQRFEKFGEISGDSFDAFIGVDAADINHNGKSEIFVTNLVNPQTGDTNLLNQSVRIRSFVLEWDGKNFKKIVEDSNWYYRVIRRPEPVGDILLGQQGSASDIFKRSGAYELMWSNGRYEPGQPLSLPKHVNIFGLTYGDVLNDGSEKMVAFGPNNHLQVFNKNGHEEFKSNDPFGGGGTYIEYLPDSPVRQKEGDSYRMERYFLPQRIHIVDMDGDGKKEIIVANNADITGNLVPRVRIFKSGHIEAFNLDQLGLSRKWKTRDISGHISDYVIADLNNDGKKDLVFSAVAKTDLLSTEKKSYIVSMDIK